MNQPASSPESSAPSPHAPPESAGTRERWWSRIETGERQIVFWATLWFFFILLAYFMLRPVREAMGIRGGTAQLQGLFLASFGAMLIAVPAYSWLVSRLPRRWLVRVVFHFFVANLCLFALLLKLESELFLTWTARVLFVWISVYGLFQTSVFWSVLADLFTSRQGKRLFGIISAGGTMGAITGSLVASQLARHLSPATLLLVPAVCLEIGLACAWRLERECARLDPESAVRAATKTGVGQSTGGGVMTGITHVLGSPYLAMICLFLFLFQLCGTQFYFTQADIVSANIESTEERTQLFAYIDLGTQLLTLVLQFFVAGALLRRFGVSVALAVLPITFASGFAALAVSPTLSALVVVVILGRGVSYGITVPSREVLFTVVSREDKYKSKSFIDTVVLRGGDAAASQIAAGLRGIGLSLTLVNGLAIPVAILWVGVAWILGQQQRRRALFNEGIASNHDENEPQAEIEDGQEREADPGGAG